MEQNFQGDLTDILRAGGSGNNSYEELLEPNSQNQNWHFTSGDDDHHHHNQTNVFSSLLEDQASHDTFGDPFSDMNDPLIISTNNINNNDSIPAGPAFFGGNEPAAAEGFYHQGGSQDVSKFRPSCNVFSRILQINPSSAGGVSSSSCSSSSNAKPEAAVAVGRCNSPRGLMMSSNAGEGGIDATMSGGGGGGGVAGAGGLQISSPRNPGAIKRRKSQAKKVVCIPAPAAANSRASGEVVPSDLWAWRKYGQKPIKGSPYPRGYYRCSSSKGCSARKQVERSRTDPNMLVITYTSEHNHPWPTQRNALAGSTRSQPSKPNNNNASSKSPQIITSQPRPIASPKEEQKSEIIMSNTTSRSSASVKEENVDQDNNNKSNTSSEKRLESLDNSAFSGTGSATHEVEFGYRPQIMSSVNDQDFFAELGEIETDPLNLLFSQSISSSTDEQNQHKELVTGNNSNKGLLENPFSLFDWSEGNNNNNTKPRV